MTKACRLRGASGSLLSQVRRQNHQFTNNQILQYYRDFIEFQLGKLSDEKLDTVLKAKP